MDSSLYTRPDKPRKIEVIERIAARSVAPERALPTIPEIVTVDRVTECHVTPPDVAKRMVSYLGEPGDYLTLEPQAGTGNLIHALYESGHSKNELTVIERQYELCNQIRKRFTGNLFIEPIQQCFLDYADEAKGKIEFPRIIMNPPFRAVKKHMAAALSLLGCGGHKCAVLVALVPITFNHEEMEIMEELGNETFPLAKVSTKIIRIHV